MEGTRGSDRVAQLQDTQISQADLDQLAGLGEAPGIDLVGWHRRGIPAVEGITGTFHAQPGSVGGLVDQMVAGGLVRQIHVFPFGIPNVTQVQVQFASGPS